MLHNIADKEVMHRSQIAHLVSLTEGMPYCTFHRKKISIIENLTREFWSVNRYFYETKFSHSVFVQLSPKSLKRVRDSIPGLVICKFDQHYTPFPQVNGTFQSSWRLYCGPNAKLPCLTRGLYLSNLDIVCCFYL